MKRILALGALFALTAITYVPVAHSDVIWATKRLAIRKVSSAHTLQVDGTYYDDSTVVTHTGAVTDTTAPFGLENFAMSPAVTADTSLAMVVAVSIGSNSTTTAAGSTCTITLQGSFDGVNWVSSPAYVASELAGGAGLMEVKPYGFSGAYPVVAALTDANMGLFTYYRVIFAHASGQDGVMRYFVKYRKSTFAPQL